MEVEYRDVPGYDGLQAGSDGTLRKLARTGKNGLQLKEKIVRGTPDSNGYLKTRHVDRFVLVHRAVAMAFHPNTDNRPQVNHKNGIVSDNRACNLEWSHPRENSRHAIETGLWGKKLAVETIELVVTLRHAGRKFREIAAETGIRQTTVRHICEKYSSRLV